MDSGWVRLLLGLGGVSLAAVGFVAISLWSSTGAMASGARLKRMEASPRWKDGAFKNELKRVDGSFGKIVATLWARGEQREPEQALPVLKRRGEEFAKAPDSGLRVTWLGHSTVLVELDGATILIDPIWSKRASPVQWAGPARFYEPPLGLEELPTLDAVVISHDHYDHLDYGTVQRMLEMPVTWVVPLGVGAHLEGWGMPLDRIVELDWWEDVELAGVKLTATPARHFSGRSALMRDQNATLWAGWAFTGPEHRVFYSGDTGMHPEFADIGEKLGPFDLTLMETGAANPLWADVHLGPEQAVIAHQMVRGGVMLPVHWGLFNLSVHSWVEPAERVMSAAQRVGVKVVLPRPGGSFELNEAMPMARWWPEEVDWVGPNQRTYWSTSVADIIESSPLYQLPVEQGS